jgi:hypothetical protein
MDRHTVLTVIRGGTAALIVLAIVAQAAVLVDAGAFDPTRFFAFFTIQSNVLGAVVLLVLAARGRRPRSPGLEVARGAATLYLTITFWVVILLLSDVDVQLGLGWVDVVLHKVSPVIVVADWLLDPPAHRMTLRSVLLWLAFPVVWLVVTLARGAADSWYPYPFLDPANGGYGSVAVTVAAVVVAFLLVAGLIVALGRWRRPVAPGALA